MAEPSKNPFMAALELKLPPPLIWIVCAAAAMALGRWLPRCSFPFAGHRVLAGLLVLAGVGVGLVAALACRRAGTTIDPHRPERSRSVVTVGMYRHSRNPMYLGLALVLLGVVAWIANALALLVVPVFCAWITRFQIRPEERALEANFGDAYRDYRSRVRRWL